MPTLAEIKEALAHLHEIPIDERHEAWFAYRDSLDAQARQLTKEQA